MSCIVAKNTCMFSCVGWAKSSIIWETKRCFTWRKAVMMTWLMPRVCRIRTSSLMKACSVDTPKVLLHPWRYQNGGHYWSRPSYCLPRLSRNIIPSEESSWFLKSHTVKLCWFTMLFVVIHVCMGNRGVFETIIFMQRIAYRLARQLRSHIGAMLLAQKCL